MTDLPILPTPQEVHNLTAKEAAALVKPASSIFGEAAAVGQPTIPTGTTHDLLLNLVERCLRSEAGVRDQQEHQKPTGWYAGRRTGFECSAATLVAMLYGVEYEAAKSTLAAEVRQAGAGCLVSDLRRPEFVVNLAQSIVTKMLEA
jgi:hypothetical protein